MHHAMYHVNCGALENSNCNKTFKECETAFKRDFYIQGTPEIEISSELEKHNVNKKFVEYFV